MDIATDRLKLRPMLPSDAQALFVLRSDAETMRYWSSPPWSDISEADAFLARSSDEALFGIERHCDKRLIGTCGFYDISTTSRRAGVGYLLGKPYWGHGYAQEAVTALLDHGFGTLGLHRVEADIDPRNVTSQRLLERLHFSREGLLRERWIVAGEISDSALYGLLARDHLPKGNRRTD